MTTPTAIQSVSEPEVPSGAAEIARRRSAPCPRTIVFGSVGHFGNGEVAFGFTFLGIAAAFYIVPLFGLVLDQPPITDSLPLGLVLLAVALLAILALRLGVSLKSESNFRRLTLSMGAIGITSAILAVLAPGSRSRHRLHQSFRYLSRAP